MTRRQLRERGIFSLTREPAELVRAKIRSRTAEDELGLLRSFVGFVDRYFHDQVATNDLTIDAVDPKSGTSEFKATAIRIEKCGER